MINFIVTGLYAASYLKIKMGKIFLKHPALGKHKNYEWLS